MDDPEAPKTEGTALLAAPSSPPVREKVRKKGKKSVSFGTEVEMREYNPDIGECEKYLPPDSTGEVKEFTWTWKTALISLMLGVIFGIALEKSGVYRPEIILDQFIFKKWTMFKTFMSAVAASVLVQGFLSTVGMWKPAFRATRAEFFCGSCHCGNVRGVPSTVLGALILGIGMAIGGSCPGTVFAQLGAGMWQGWMTVLGGLTAAVIYGFVGPNLNKFVYWLPIKHASIDAILDIRYWAVSIPLFLIIVCIVALIETQRNWLVDTPNKGGKHTFFLLVDYWPPEIGGTMIGLLHLPAIVFVVVTLGSSTTFMVVVTSILKFIFQVNVDEREGFKPFAGDEWWWQVVYLLGAILGSGVSAVSAGHFGAVKALAWWQHFLGGFLMICGSRLAGG